MTNSIRFGLTAALTLLACVASAAPPLVKTINLGPAIPFASPQQIAMAPAANRVYIFNGAPAATAQIGVVDTTAGLFLAALQPECNRGGWALAKARRRQEELWIKYTNR